MNRLTEQVDELLRGHGADLVGFADITQIPSAQRLDLPVGIAFALKYPTAVIRGIAELPTPEYFAHYHTLNDQIATLQDRTAEFLSAKGYAVSAEQSSQAHWTEDDYTTRLPRKTVATRAGLGWIGKCALFVTEEYGSAIRLGTVLTDAPLTVSAPVDASKCGACDACVRACPAQAVSGKNWHKDMQRAEFFDAAACAKCARERSALALGQGGVHNAVCGKCIEVCPRTRRYTHID